MKWEACQEFMGFFLFHDELNNFNNARARLLGSIFRMTLIVL